MHHYTTVYIQEVRWHSGWWWPIWSRCAYPADNDKYACLYILIFYLVEVMGVHVRTHIGTIVLWQLYSLTWHSLGSALVMYTVCHYGRISHNRLLGYGNLDQTTLMIIVVMPQSSCNNIYTGPEQAKFELSGHSQWCRTEVLFWVQANFTGCRGNSNCAVGFAHIHLGGSGGMLPQKNFGI